MNLKLRAIAIASILATLALCAIALTGLWHPNAPQEAMKVYLPQITLPTVLAAGVIDGINPCAFTVLLLFITALTSTLQAGDGNVSRIRARILGLGGIYIASIFFTYLALGVGVLASLDFFTRQHIPARVGAIARDMARKATLPALIAGGILIGLCTVPCSGAVYLGVLSLLALQPTALQGYSYLVLYNVVFVLPLLVILAVASVRPALNRLAHWNLHHKERVRLALGSGVVAMGLAILATV